MFYSFVNRKSRNKKSAFTGAVYSGKRSEINSALPGIPRYRIFHQASTGFISVETIRQSALKRVESFCAHDKKSPYLIEETTSTPPHILGNWPRLEIVFSCIDNPQDNPADQVKLIKPDKYDRLEKLKTLLDGGAITRGEYEQEKHKLLSE